MSEPSKGEESAEEKAERSHRTFVNLMAAIAALAIAVGLVWAFKALDQQQKLQRCLNSGRRDCAELVDPSAAGQKAP